jgi:hypothetical protein
MKRPHLSLMNDLRVDPKIVADQLGHTLDVNQNIYAQSGEKKGGRRLAGMSAAECLPNGVFWSTTKSYLRHLWLSDALFSTQPSLTNPSFAFRTLLIEVGSRYIVICFVPCFCCTSWSQTTMARRILKAW